MFPFFGKKTTKNIAVIDVSPSGAAAAYATISGVAPPAIVYASRAETSAYGAGPAGSLRALDAVARDLSSRGAPKLRSMTGSGSVERTTLLIESPWQTSSLTTKVIEREKPFQVTGAMLTEALTEAGGEAKIVGTVLNGYETPDPIGKKVKRAELSVLSSKLEGEVVRLAKRAAREIGGAAPLDIVSFPNSATSVLKGFFPHERDFLMVRAGMETTEIAFVKQGHLAAIQTAPVGAAAFYAAAEHAGISAGPTFEGIIDTKRNKELDARMTEAEKGWVEGVHDALLTIASGGALPRTLFLFSEGKTLPLFKRLLDAPLLHALWLSDEPLSVVPVGPRHFAPYLRQIEGVESDSILDLLCLLSRLS